MGTKQAFNLLESLGETLNRIEKHNAHQIDVDLALETCRDLYSTLLNLNNTENGYCETTTSSVKKEKKIKAKSNKKVPKQNLVVPSIEETTIDIEDEINDNTKLSAPTITKETVEKPENVTSNKKQEVIIIEENDIEDHITKNDDEVVLKNSETLNDLIETKPAESLGESLGKNFISMNESIGTKENDLASRFQSKPITDIKAAISLGDRFLFIKELFEGSADDFNNTIQTLNNQNSINDAQDFLSTKNWDIDDETVKYFLSIVQRKFH